MNKDYKIYDKNGTLLKSEDVIDADGAILLDFCGEWYIAGQREMWPIEEFTLQCYKDGYCLVDFEKSQG